MPASSKVGHFLSAHTHTNKVAQNRADACVATLNRLFVLDFFGRSVRFCGEQVLSAKTYSAGARGPRAGRLMMKRNEISVIDSKHAESGSGY